MKQCDHESVSRRKIKFVKEIKVMQCQPHSALIIDLRKFYPLRNGVVRGKGTRSAMAARAFHTKGVDVGDL